MASNKGAKPRRKVGAPTKASGKKTVRKPSQSRAAKRVSPKKLRAAAAKRRSKVLPKRKAAKKQAPKVGPLSPKLQKRIDDQNKKAEDLMARGRQRGFVTYDEILKSFPNIETDVLFLEELYEKFSTAHIDV